MYFVTYLLEKKQCETLKGINIPRVCLLTACRTEFGFGVGDDDNSLPKKLHGGRGGLCSSVSGFPDSVFQLNPDGTAQS